MARLSPLKLTGTSSEMLYWTEWINSLSSTLSFSLPPKELLLRFVAESIDLTRSWRSPINDCWLNMTADGYIRAYLVDKIYSYQLASKCLLKDIYSSTHCAAALSSRQLGRVCRRTVAHMMLENTLSVKDPRFHSKAKTTVFHALRSTDVRRKS